MCYFRLLLFSLCVHLSIQSTGDSSPYYLKCVERCIMLNCTEDGTNFLDTEKQPLVLKLTRWYCDDECGYECMWNTVFSFQKRKWRIPQFHGKWPFIRLLGMQEPASVIFSLLNLYFNMRMLRRFRREVKPDSPFYFMWHVYCMVCVNAWMWSSVFHTRDLPLTEFMDYSCAFSLIIMSAYCMSMRLLMNAPRIVRLSVTSFFGLFFSNHVAYLYTGLFSYSYNMQLNIVIGSMTAFIWFAWCAYNRNRMPYVWKCAAFVTLAGISTLLEIIDRPPLFFIYDSHSLWHLSSAPLTVLFYSFIIDDCKYLRKIRLEDKKTKEK